VSFEPSIDDDTLLSTRMADADYYCYPSLADRGESFGVAPVEAMAMGYAPILSNLACFREFAEDGLNCFVFDHRNGDPIANLTKALRCAMDSPDRTRDMGLNAVQTAQKFNFVAVANAYLADWRSLIKTVKSV
jgi:glycosyltransferase involved in cell wall biosynthesis